MDKRIFLFSVILSLCVIKLIAATSQPGPDEKKDLLTGAIDPYQSGRMRIKFFKAAGKNNELEQEEFLADKKNPEGAIQPYDRWELLLEFDRNGNGMLDWFEFDSYRKDFRMKVLREFDKNRNQRLQGAERLAANEALHSGKFPPKTATSQPTSMPASVPAPRSGGSADADNEEIVEPESPQEEDTLSRFDADGDGQLSEQERQAMLETLRNERREQFLQQYDLDGDGVLSEEERRAMREEQRIQQQSWQEMRQRWEVRLFDTDGDGILDENEQAQAREFQREFGRIFEEMRQSDMDLDGDGEISRMERVGAEMRQRAVGMRVMARITAELDQNGDGMVTPDERSAFGERMRSGIDRSINNLFDFGDEDGDGQYTPQERRNILDTFRNEMNIRRQESDVNGDGILDVNETSEMVFRLLEEMEILNPTEAEPITP